VSILEEGKLVDQVNEANKLIRILQTVCSERISILEDDLKENHAIYDVDDEDHLQGQLRHFDIIKSWAVKYLDKYDISSVTDHNFNPEDKLTPVEYEHTEEKLLDHLIRYYKQWRHDQDIDSGDEFWDSLDGYDINVYNSREYDDHKEYKYSVVCYPLWEDSKGNYSVNTDKEIATYYIDDRIFLNGILKLIKKESK